MISKSQNIPIMSPKQVVANSRRTRKGFVVVAVRNVTSAFWPRCDCDAMFFFGAVFCFGQKGSFCEHVFFDTCFFWQCGFSFVCCAKCFGCTICSICELFVFVCARFVRFWQQDCELSCAMSLFWWPLLRKFQVLMKCLRLFASLFRCSFSPRAAAHSP